MGTTTRIHVHNSCADVTSNVVLMYLQPVDPQDNYLYSAWNVLNPSPGSQQQVELNTSFSASIAAVGSSVQDYSDPVALTLGAPALITDQNNQSPAIVGISTRPITGDEVGLDNECISPPTPLSAIWYVNGRKVVETNNTPATALNAGFVTTFQLQQSVWVMFGQRPQTTTTYTIQTFGEAVEIPIPNGAADVYIEAFTNPHGIDTFQPLTANNFNALVQRSVRDFVSYRRSSLLREGSRLRAGTNSPQATTKDISDVSVQPLSGEPVLNGHGVGYVVFDGTKVAEVHSGLFPPSADLPVEGREYKVTGTYDANHLPFSYAVKCTKADRPVSAFELTTV
jgi:hypothetical protein